MKLSLSLILLFISILGHAQNNSVKKYWFNDIVQLGQDPNKVILEGSSCTNLEKELNAIKSWSKRIGEVPRETSCECKNGLCSIDVSNIVPYLVRSKQGTCPAFNGPNCWNGALVATKLLPNLRYTSREEMAFWMKSPLCTERALNESPLPGDIIAIRNEKGEEVHGFIHLTENLSFSKNGASSEAPYSLQWPDWVYKVYSVNKECRAVTNIPASCKNHSKIYACESITDYLKKNPIKDKLARSTWEALENEDCSISTQAFSKLVNEDVIKLAKASLLAVAELAEAKMIKAKTKEDKFIWHAISVKARANLEQTRVF